MLFDTLRQVAGDRQEGKVVWLLPENDEFEPIQVDLDTQAMVIEGVVVGVIRNGSRVH